MNRQLAFTADVTKCPLKISLVTHWSEDGSCKCHPDRKLGHSNAGKVAKILEGAYAALELLNAEELNELFSAYTIKSNLQQEQQDLLKNVAITAFVRSAVGGRRT